LRSISLYPHAVATTPAEPPGRVAHPPGDVSLPSVPKVGLRISIFEACSAFTRVTACGLARSPCDPSTPEASAASLPPRLLRLLLAGATVARRDLHPLKTGACHGARDIIQWP